MAVGYTYIITLYSCSPTEKRMQATEIPTNMPNITQLNRNWMTTNILGNTGSWFGIGCVWGRTLSVSSINQWSHRKLDPSPYGCGSKWCNMKPLQLRIVYIYVVHCSETCHVISSHIYIYIICMQYVYMYVYIYIYILIDAYVFVLVYIVLIHNIVWFPLIYSIPILFVTFSDLRAGRVYQPRRLVSDPFQLRTLYGYV